MSGAGAAAQSAQPDSIALSVVIPCHNSERTIGEQLDALTRQRIDGEWEVVVVDDGSTDDTCGVVVGYRDRLNLVLVRSEGGPTGPARARNVGVRAARGEFILFCDGDDVVDDAWAEKLQLALRDHDFVCCRWNEERLNGPTEIAAYGKLPPGLIYYSDSFLPLAASGTLAVRRSLHEAVGGFDESFVRGGEDEDYCWRIQQLTGESLQLVPDAILHYRYRTDLRAMFLQARDFGAAEVYAYVKWREYLEPLPRQWPGGLWAWLRVLSGARRIRDRGSFGSWLRAVGRLTGQVEASARLGVLHLCSDPTLSRPPLSRTLRRSM